MAKHIVTCRYCKQKFDANAEPSVQPQPKWYYHQSCYETYLQNLTQDEKDEIEFYKYVKNLFLEDYNYLVTKKLAERYIKENGYSYSGMLKSLKWFYEIQHNPVDKANGSIGIIPYCYNSARDYYYALYMAKLANEEKDISLYIPTVKEITIESPEVYIKPPKLFDLGDDEDEQ